MNEAREHRRLAEALGHVFQDPAWLRRALTHRSHAADNNERLEFLGDALLNFVIAEALFERRPGAEEGELSRLRASLVREPALAGLARDLALGELLQLGEGERKSGGWRRDSTLADAFEALIGAIYRDAGFEAARAACLRCFAPLLEHLPDAESLKDAKTRLQEWLQARARPRPRYEVVAESGPPHARAFEVLCALEDAPVEARASGSSRRIAEQRAAETLLQELHRHA
ncbi:MAG TPA: ribonuclease III [Nevskiaceae bacterium]|nr:ribonuclease III [Nevskiaceae bacterium]